MQDVGHILNRKRFMVFPPASAVCILILSAAITTAQPSPKPGKEVKAKEVDQQSVGDPKKIDMPGGGYKLVYKNKDGEVCREESHNDLGAKTETKTITAVYPSGASAREEVETFGDKNGKLGVKVSKTEKEL